MCSTVPWPGHEPLANNMHPLSWVFLHRVCAASVHVLHTSSCTVAAVLMGSIATVELSRGGGSAIAGTLPSTRLADAGMMSLGHTEVALVHV